MFSVLKISLCVVALTVSACAGTQKLPGCLISIQHHDDKEITCVKNKQCAGVPDQEKCVPDAFLQQSEQRNDRFL